MSDSIIAPAVWQANPLLQNAGAVPGFMRQDWDATSSHAFGAWRVAERQDPMSGQTQNLSPGNPEESSDPATMPEPILAETDFAAPITPPLVYSEVELAERLQLAREEGRLEGHDAAMKQAVHELELQRQALYNVAQALQDLRSDPRQWLMPLQKLSVHIAQELVRAELRLDAAVIDRLIHACVDMLDPGQEPVVVQVHPEDLQRLGEGSIPGVTFEADESLSPGSVRAKRLDAQVEDLIEDRLAQICRQVLEGNP